MEFREAVKTCLKKYADFGGRASRSEYWWFVLAGGATLFVASLIDTITIGSPIGLFYTLAILGLAIPTLAAQARRLHDTGHSAWWILIQLVPIAGLILLIVWWCTDSDRGSNAYGEPPLLASASARSESPSAGPATREVSTDLSRLEQLHALHEKGALTAEEFAAQKAKLLG